VTDKKRGGTPSVQRLKDDQQQMRGGKSREGNWTAKRGGEGETELLQPLGEQVSGGSTWNTRSTGTVKDEGVYPGEEKEQWEPISDFRTSPQCRVAGGVP